MKLLIQRVKKAECKVREKIAGGIDQGLLVFVGFNEQDTKKDLDYIVKKLVNLRIFENNKGKIHYSVSDKKYKVLIIPQFTLYGSAKKGNRPDFTSAMKPKPAKEFFGDMVNKLKTELPGSVETGEFGAEMEITTVNDGPFSIIIDSLEKGKG